MVHTKSFFSLPPPPKHEEPLILVLSLRFIDSIPALTAMWPILCPALPSSRSSLCASHCRSSSAMSEPWRFVVAFNFRVCIGFVADLARERHPVLQAHFSRHPRGDEPHELRVRQRDPTEQVILWGSERVSSFPSFLPISLVFLHSDLPVIPATLLAHLVTELVVR